METTILNKSAKISGDKAIITETTETTLELFQLENQLRDLKMQKERLIEQNKYAISEFNKVAAKETEIQGLINQLKSQSVEPQAPEAIV